MLTIAFLGQLFAEGARVRHELGRFIRVHFGPAIWTYGAETVHALIRFYHCDT